jgi:hypothetical protein
MYYPIVVAVLTLLNQGNLRHVTILRTAHIYLNINKSGTTVPAGVLPKLASFPLLQVMSQTTSHNMK